MRMRSHEYGLGYIVIEGRLVASMPHCLTASISACPVPSAFVHPTAFTVPSSLCRLLCISSVTGGLLSHLAC